MLNLDYLKLGLNGKEIKLFEKIIASYTGIEYQDRNKLERIAGSPGIVEKLIKKGILELGTDRTHLKLEGRVHRWVGEARYKLNI